ncbi:flagellar basal body rod protein [Aquincola sp. S2]|uniref:Flagellar basal body rod protein n=1 Tax=Pseudaquabacterium terrae TaxID=2732868 RepID=A0ABX2EJ38_9BURK|nr:flagellar basal body rod protein [Aquabacterium terrae]NRF68657.1 flagellar basal body rod protein [Aquabacterium terrae]
MGLQSTSSIALSGMQAAMQRLGSASHNVANLGTDGFRREIASAQTQPGGGVFVTLSTAAEAGNALADDVVAQRVALYEFKANMQTFKTEQEMLGSLLDLRA